MDELWQTENHPHVARRSFFNAMERELVDKDHSIPSREHPICIRLAFPKRLWFFPVDNDGYNVVSMVLFRVL